MTNRQAVLWVVVSLWLVAAVLALPVQRHGRIAE
jgi:hypothetical protein